MINLAQEAVTSQENAVRKDGSTTIEVDFESFRLAINPRLQALLSSGEKLAAFSDSTLLPDQLLLKFVGLPHQVLLN